MHFKQLEVFLHVMRLKSFSKAAEALYLSQPTVSAHIRSLEDELGSQLFIRSTKEITPTRAGKSFHPYAAELMTIQEKALTDLQKLTTEVKGVLTIACSTVPSQYLMPQILPQLTSQYPQVFFTIKQYDSQDVIQKVIDMEAEVGICGSKKERVPCVFVPIAADPLVVVTPNTPMYQSFGPHLPIEELKKATFILREEGSGTRKESEQFLLSIGLEPNHLQSSVQLHSTESILQGVRNGLGVSIVSQRAARDFADMGLVRLFYMETESLHRMLYLVYHKNHPLTPAAEAFIETVTQCCKTENVKKSSLPLS